MAIMLAVLLLAGQSDAFVRAEEGVGDAPQTETSSEKVGTDTPDTGNTAGADNTGTPDNTAGGGNTENPDNTLDQDDNNGDADNKDTGDQQGEGDGQDQCVCETACTAGKVNADCPVCAVDYSACAKNVGEGENPAEEAEITEEIPPAQTVSGNGDDLAAEPAMLTGEGVETYAEGDKFLVNLLKYQVTDDDAGEVKVIGPKYVSDVTNDLIIPSKVTDDNGKEWNVTSIDIWAFQNCSYLTSVEIEQGITRIGFEAFNCCTSLKSVTIPESVTAIEGRVFSDCVALREVNIPPHISSIVNAMFFNCGALRKIDFPQNITAIEGWAFGRCDNLTEVSIPSTITEIGKEAFKECSRLEKVTISDSVTKIKAGTFLNCRNLATLEIAVSRPDPILVEDETVFEGYPASLSRKIVFKNADGTAELTGSKLARAQMTYLNAPDGNTDDDMWYGWSVDRPDTYNVTIHVKKDGEEWVDHGKKYALKEDGDTEFITDLAHVPNGTYSIYDITGISEDSLSAMARDTGMDTNIDVTVQDNDAEATVNYYTVTFYDGDVAYSEDTLQKPQIVLSGSKAVRPPDPGKTGYRFAGWKTEDGISFDFNTAINANTDIYASWQKVDTPIPVLTITASADEGGSISPSGTVSVNEGDSQTFTITPKEGNRIKAVTVDGEDKTAELMETPTGARYYTFSNVTKNHTIHAVFENDSGNPGGGGDNPNPGGGGDNPNPGGGGDEPNPGGGGDNPNPGGGSGGSGDNPNSGGGDNTENVQVTVVSETASPQAENSAVADTGTPQASNGQENAASATGQTTGGTGTAADGKEPKTGDTSYLEVYATLAMIAGLTWLLLCFMDEARGMSEREKEVFVAAFIRWGKKGGAFRKCCAMAAIFCLLAYYHTIGKRVGRNALPESYLGQAS